MQPGLIKYRQIVSQTLWLLMACIGTYAKAQEITLTQPEIISSRQGLPQAFVPGIIQDQQGFIWMATRDGLCRYDGNNFKVFQPSTNGKPGISSSSLFGLSLDQQGKIWVFSDQNDIDVIDPLHETFKNVSRQPFFKQHAERESDIIDAQFIDRQGRLWISFLSGKIICTDLATHYLRLYKRKPIPGYFPTFSAFIQDKRGTMWMSNKTGLYQLDQHSNRFDQYVLPDNDIRGILARNNGDLLILSKRSVMLVKPETAHVQSFTIPVLPNLDADTEWHHTNIVADSQGNEYFDQYNLLFRFSRENAIMVVERLTEKTKFRSLFIDRSDVLWAGTDKAGVLKYNLRANIFKAMPYQKDFYHDLLSKNLGLPVNQVPPIPKGVLAYNFRYTFDKTGKMWFNMGNNLIYQIDLQTKRVLSVPVPLPPLARYAWTDPVVPMATDPVGRIWIMTDSLAMYYERGQWHPFRFPIRAKADTVGQRNSVAQVTKIEGYILQMVVDEQALWVATRTNGLYRVDRATGQIKQYSHQPSNLASLSSDQLFCIFDDSQDKNSLWIGTFGSGLCRFDKRTGSCRRFTTQNGLPNNVVYAAIPDQQGFLWIATNQGICRMDIHFFHTRIYTHEDGLLADEFNRFHFLHLPGPVRRGRDAAPPPFRSDGTADDRIILGGLEGITAFYPHQLRDDTYQPPVQITDIQINNQPLLAKNLTDSLPPQAVDRLDLRYDQNFITIAFAALQYNRQTKIRYRYQLMGLNKHWIETNRPIAEYTDLRWGNYILRLNASNTSGIWSKHVRVVTIIIRPPWWATWWAIVLYSLLVAGAGYGLIRIYLNRQQTKQLKAVDALKARFYTNITHEFRTPLTLILAPVEQLRQRLPDTADQQQLDLISQNANQLLGLVNQLMELSKAEANVLKVRESQENLVEFLARLIQSFEPYATEKGIQIVFRAVKINTNYWFDTGKLERIIYNLLANALKFTPVGGRVIVSITANDSHELIDSTDTDFGKKSLVHLEISDNGIGIAPEKLPYVFDRFFQADNSSAESKNGMGIGLALVKELVEIQQGTIQVTSKLSIGTTFLVNLPYRIAAPESSVSQSPATVQQSEDTQKLTTYEQRSDESPVVLIVEDNVALSDFIADNLPTNYQIHRATNGAEGWEKALELGPDLIISDVMMPIMNGYEFCQQLKSDSRTSHIPIILLTAKTSIDSKLQGLSSGADDYVAKPFYVQELQLRIRNLLEQRRQLRQWVSTSLTSPDSLPASSPATDPLVEKLCQLIEEHLDDATFGVDELMLASGMSRMNLHRKLKALVDISTGEFIRNYRLKRAAQLLRQGRSVSEAAYLVGFEDPSYFARSFRKLYQMTPSAFSREN